MTKTLQFSLWFFKKSLKAPQSKLVGLDPSCHHFVFCRYKVDDKLVFQGEGTQRAISRRFIGQSLKTEAFTKLRFIYQYAVERSKDLQCSPPLNLAKLENGVQTTKLKNLFIIIGSVSQSLNWEVRTIKL